MVERDQTVEDPISPGDQFKICMLLIMLITAKKLKKFRTEVLLVTLVLPLAPTLLSSRVSHNTLDWGRDQHFFLLRN